jgi:TatD DNase family protein
LVAEISIQRAVKLLDAHNHLHDGRLAPHREAIIAELERIGLSKAVVNGTREEDWEAVVVLAATHNFVIPSFGLHPWHVASRSRDWLERLRELLVAHPHAGVGEIGLDRWIEGYDLAQQTEVCVGQLALAAELNRPATLHCIRAWGPLWDLVRSQPLPACGLLLHAYGGSQEMVAGFVELGAYFSFSPSFLQERKAPQREVFRHLPADRILLETDAPDLRPPDECNPRPLRGEGGEPINHPANIDLTYTTLAELRGVESEALAAQVAENFARLFGE